MQTGAAANDSEPGASQTPSTTVYHGGARPRHSPAVQDDAAFNRKLKHMGKSMKHAEFAFLYITSLLYTLIYDVWNAAQCQTAGNWVLGNKGVKAPQCCLKIIGEFFCSCLFTKSSP